MAPLILLGNRWTVSDGGIGSANSGGLGARPSLGTPALLWLKVAQRLRSGRFAHTKKTMSAPSAPVLTYNPTMKKLSLEEKVVLQVALLQAEVPIRELAKQAGMQPHKVRYILSSFNESGIFLGKRAHVNAAAIGLVEYQTYLSLGAVTDAQHKEFPKFVSGLEGVSVVTDLAGEFQYDVRIMARTASDLNAVLDTIVARYPTLKVEDLCIVREQFYCGARYVEHEKLTKTKALHYGHTEQPIKIDEVGQRILSVLANSDYDSHREVARKLGMSISTVAYRISAMEREGIISGYYYLCDVRPVGQMPIILLLKTTKLGEMDRERFIRFCLAHKRIAVIDSLIGRWSMRLIVRVETHEEARQIVHELQNELGSHLLSVRLMPQLKLFHYATFPFRTRFAT